MEGDASKTLSTCFQGFPGRDVTNDLQGHGTRSTLRMIAILVDTHNGGAVELSASLRAALFSESTQRHPAKQFVRLIGHLALVPAE